MPITINVNGLTLCHQGSGGIAHNTLPDVCKTPDKGIPIPFENEAYSRDLARGTVSVFADGGHSIAHAGSIFARSVFDEPGSLGGVISGTHRAEAEWLSHSFDVFFEGQPACRLTDKLFMNHRNTVCLAGLQQPDLSDLELIDLICDLACACLTALKGRLAPGQTYQSCLNQGVVELFYDGAYPKPDSPLWREVPFSRANGWELIASRTREGVPTANYIRPNSRRLDIVQVKNGRMLKLYDVKFPGDGIEPERKKEYRQIAEKHTGSSDNYQEFNVDEYCHCGEPPTATAPVTESATERLPQADPGFGDYALLGALGIATVALALVPFDGPLGEGAAGSGFLAQAARLGLHFGL